MAVSLNTYKTKGIVLLSLDLVADSSHCSRINPNLL